jgi:hypothetical protein
MAKDKFRLCSECGRMMERCRVVSQDAEGNLVYCCRQCFKTLDMDKYLYEYLNPPGYGPGV